MQFDHVIQKGVWVGSTAQIECLRRLARDANFEGYCDLDSYLKQIEASHNEEGIDGARGPIDDDARERYEGHFRDAWERSRTFG
jgi:hypothetical protein